MTARERSASFSRGPFCVVGELATELFPPLVKGGFWGGWSRRNQKQRFKLIKNEGTNADQVATLSEALCLIAP
jgi:hypothetical protein